MSTKKTELRKELAEVADNISRCLNRPYGGLSDVELLLLESHEALLRAVSALLRKERT